MIDLGSDWQTYFRFRDEFEEALDPVRYTLHWLDEQVLTGEFMVWGTLRAAILCKIEHYPTGARDIHGMLAAGDLETIVEKLIPDAEEWAREQGCIGSKIESRAGWVRVLKGAGYELHQSTLRKDL